MEKSVVTSKLTYIFEDGAVEANLGLVFRFVWLGNVGMRDGRLKLNC